MEGKVSFSRGKKIILIILTVVVVASLGAGWMFKDELKIMSSIKKLEDGSPAYYMEIDSDYHFTDFLNSGGASSDQAVSGFLTKKISKGFYSVDVENDGLACSTISAMTQDGTHVWGRNFDWSDSVPIIVKSKPKDGYSSISTCDFRNITGDVNVKPEGIANKMLAIAALYVPMDGINSAGLCVADLEVNEGGMPKVDTSKVDLTVTTAIRLLLNKAATVDEAVALLKQYDIHASGGISHHISIADASGKSVAVEFTQDGIAVVDTKFVTNFNLAVGDIEAGGESAKVRYETLKAIYEERGGVLTSEQVKDAISQVAQVGGEYPTQWSVVYDRGKAAVDYYFKGDFSKAYSYSVGD